MHTIVTMVILICSSATCTPSTALHKFEIKVGSRACGMYRDQVAANHGGVENYLNRAFNYTLAPNEHFQVACS